MPWRKDGLFNDPETTGYPFEQNSCIHTSNSKIIEPNAQSNTTMSRGNPKSICDIGFGKNVLNMTSKEYRRNKNW